MSFLDPDDRDRMRDAAAARAADSSLPVLVRLCDGKRFRIVLQARSPNGPAELVACDGPPFENVHTTNDRLLVDFRDPRKPEAQPDRCGRGALCEWMRAAVEAPESQGVNFTRRRMEHPDTLAVVVRYTVTIGQRSPVLARACPACGGNPNEESVPR